MRRTAALIVGGGPAGAAAAIVLARGGLAPLLVERRAAPAGIVCGGFLSWDSLAALDALGVPAAALGARPISRVRICCGARTVEARLPHPAAGLSRATLDAALLDCAAAAGAEIRRGVAATRIDGDRAWLADGTTIAADALFVATGKHALRGAPRDGAGEGLVGLRTTLAPGDADLDGVIELHLFEGGYAGLLIQEDGRANLCLSVAPWRLRAAGGRPDQLVAALAAEAPRLAARAAGAGDWASIAGVPYGWRATAGGAGRFRIGDQAAVIASLVGDGMGIALASGRSAAAALLAGAPSGAWQAGFAASAARPIALAEALRHLAEGPARALLPAAGRIPGLIGLAARLTRIA